MMANNTIVAIAESSPLGLAMHAKVKLPVFATLLAYHPRNGRASDPAQQGANENRVAPHEGKEAASAAQSAARIVA